MQHILRNIYFFKKSQKNPKWFWITGKNKCLHILYTYGRTTSQQTLGQDNVYALKYRMIDRENSIKDILPQWYALTMQLHILVYTDLEVTVYLLLERKNKFLINLLLNKLHTINRHKIFKWSKNAAYQWCLFCAYYE